MELGHRENGAPLTYMTSTTARNALLPVGISGIASLAACRTRNPTAPMTLSKRRLLLLEMSAPPSLVSCEYSPGVGLGEHAEDN